ncbi:MAG: hypothetical protein HUJ93_05890, partial [Bacteroidales bacterium]|nr:hypothetical protein [Bacteroidales bacterium]
MKKLLFSLILLMVSVGSQARWKITETGSIRWDVTTDNCPHSDHIEMAGEQMACVVRWALDEDAALSVERSLVFPMLRTLPNTTRASLMQRMGVDIPSLISVDELCIRARKTTEVEINGMFRAVEMLCVGEENLGKEHNADLTPVISLERKIFPSVDKPMVCELYTLVNVSKDPVMVYIPEFAQRITTPEKNGKDGSYIIDASIQDTGHYRLQPEESISFSAVFQAFKAKGGAKLTPDVQAELAARMKFISDDIDSALVLETPDPVINTMFRYSKIRASESIFRTAGGLMHGPGGESYYAAIWANDQAEYVNAFFPYLGYSKGVESASNSFSHFARFMNDEYKPIPSSIIAEGTDIWHGAGDRGDGAMIAYGASRFALSLGDKAEAQRLWPLIEWCLEFCRRKITSDGVVASDSDELEGRFPAGKANLCTSSLYYDALISAAYLARELRLPASVSASYRKQAAAMEENIEKYFGANVQGFDTYRYYDGNDLLRSWICIPLVMGIDRRSDATLDALFSPLLWKEDGLLTQQGSETFWDRTTLYALRGAFYAGANELAGKKLSEYSTRRLLGDHVPYAIEAWPEGSQRHLSAESGLYCRIITEGVFGMRPTGLHSFEVKPSL